MAKKSNDTIPAARRDGLVVETLPDEILVYDTERHKAHCLNRTAALVWEHCDGRTTVADVARRLTEEFQAPVEPAVVRLAVEQLGKARLLTETPRHPTGLSRREALKRLGVAAAVALPLVTTIVSPTAAGVVSCAELGQECGNPTFGPIECCAPLACVSGECVQD